MLTLPQIHAITAQITYKEGWFIGIGSDSERHWLMWSFTSPDYTRGRVPTSWNSRKWYLSAHMTESEIVQTALAAVLMAEEHEAREAFSYKGKHLFNPHISIEAMLSVCDRLEVRA